MVEVGVGLGLRREEGNSMAMVEKGVLFEEDCKEVPNAKDEEGEASFYTPEEVPWHGKTWLQVAKIPLRWNILSNGPSTADGLELLCFKIFSIL